MNYSPREISEILGLRSEENLVSYQIKNISFDSRKIIFPASSLFFCLVTDKNNGHKYIDQAYAKGVRNFVISEDAPSLENCNFYRVENTLQALQSLASVHREKQTLELLAITGSYGKTIVKEWLNELLYESTELVRSPKSYNSQIGVPYSLLQIKARHQLAIIEVGISQKGEMQKQAEMVKPTIGILTNIGAAHDRGFSNQEEKIKEKLLLFQSCKQLILPKEQSILKHLNTQNKTCILWEILSVDKTTKRLTFKINDKEFRINVPFTNTIALNNLMPCICFLHCHDYTIAQIEEKIKSLPEISMRLEMKQGINDSLIINDAYIADLSSLQMALDFQEENAQGKKKILIISDFAFHQNHKEEQYANLNALILENKIDQLYVIGHEAQQNLSFNKLIGFKNLEETIGYFKENPISEACILIKGSRTYKLESLADFFSNQVHDTVLEIDLNALGQNISIYRSQLNHDTKIMAVVKASAYGSGVEIAKTLVQHQIDYLAVAFPYEGIALRKSGIRLPILVLNPQRGSLPDLVQYKLEPEIYDLQQLKALAEFIKTPMSIHLNFNTGMNRLGLEETQIKALLDLLKKQPLLIVSSVFSHLSSSEDDREDAYNQRQISLFEKITNRLSESIDTPFIKHILNSAGIARMPEYQLDLVRLGLGMYGVDISGQLSHLQKVHKLKTRIIQIKSLSKGSFIGYNKKQALERDSIIATIPVGYADGIPINLGLGNYSFLIKGKHAPTLGKICMDLIMLDITDIQADIGDEVILFDSHHKIETMAAAAETIPYDILSSISSRVKRIYIHD